MQPLTLTLALFVGCAADPLPPLTADGPRGTATRARYDACISRAVASILATTEDYPARGAASVADGSCAEARIGLDAAISVDNKKHPGAASFAAGYVEDYRKRTISETELRCCVPERETRRFDSLAMV